MGGLQPAGTMHLRQPECFQDDGLLKTRTVAVCLSILPASLLLPSNHEGRSALNARCKH